MTHSNTSKKTYAFIDHQNIAIAAAKNDQMLDYQVLSEILETQYKVQKIFLFDSHYGSPHHKSTVEQLENYDFDLHIRVPLIWRKERFQSNIDDDLLRKIHATKKEHERTLVMSSDVNLIRSARQIVRRNAFLALVDERILPNKLSGIQTEFINAFDDPPLLITTKIKPAKSYDIETISSKKSSTYERRSFQKQRIDIFFKDEKYNNTP